MFIEDMMGDFGRGVFMVVFVRVVGCVELLIEIVFVIVFFIVVKVVFFVLEVSVVLLIVEIEDGEDL